MNILGLNSFLHSSSASLMNNGNIIGSLEEERLSREKYTHEFPKKSIDWLLKKNNMNINDIDVMGFSWNPYLELLYGIRHTIRYFPHSLYSVFNVTTDTPILPRIKNICRIKKIIKQYYPEYKGNNKFYYIDHHMTHAANAFFCSPYEEAAVLVVDGLGDNYDSISIWKGEGSNINKIKSIKFPNSLGTYYLCFVTHLGFLETSGPGKVMGLSSYGKDTYVNDFSDMININYKKQNCNINLDKTKYHLYGRYRTVSKEFEKIIGKRRNDREPLTNKHADIAYALQKSFEEGILGVVQLTKQITKCNNLCLGGGVALNSVANGIINNSGHFQKVYISSAPDDSGTSLGAAQYISHHMMSYKRLVGNMNGSYTGPDYIEEEIESCILKYSTFIHFERRRDYIDYAAQLLANGFIVGWFQGKMEYGPRALGNRSILADPRNSNIKYYLNKKVKFRENYRPYASAVLEEEVDNYFYRNNNNPSPNMSFVYNVREERKEAIKGTVHVDGTVRIQTVNARDNIAFRKLIEKFYELTGIPMVINTSFNINKEPICCNPDDAINCLLKSGLDYLVMGKYVVSKKKEKNNKSDSN